VNNIIPDKNLHIITLNIPYPADYGGMIDSFHRIRSLNKLGINIHLHCFEYGRSHSRELETLCKTVNYYPRRTSILNHFSFLPYNVFSRRSDHLLENLTKDNFPILFDGLHTTYYLDHPALSGRKKFVRVHNIEHLYFNILAEYEKNPIRKLYFLIEAEKLKHYEKIVNKADNLLSVSEIDQEYFEGKYHNSVLIPSFHPFDQVECLQGVGEYIIYHGDLSVNENINACEFLISKIFSKVPYSCIIAGKNPPEQLKTKAAGYKNISIIANPDNDQMSGLIKNAQLNLLFTLSANGLKLKLLISLFSGRHCLVNRNMTKGTLLGPACIIEDSADGIIDKIHHLMKQPFTEGMIAERERMLLMYSNSVNAKRLSRLIFPD
jgi:hypothetical protein